MRPAPASDHVPRRHSRWHGSSSRRSHAPWRRGRLAGDGGMTQMGDLRGAEQRKADVLAALDDNHDVWLATADGSGRPHLIAVSCWWDGSRVIITTTTGSRSARNLVSTGLARLAIGDPDDVIVIDASVEDRIGVSEADSALAAGFANAVGWAPRQIRE